MSENSVGSGAQEKNPYWIAAEERLRNAGVAFGQKPEQTQTQPILPAFMNTAYPAIYGSTYPQIPQVAQGSYSWYPPPPPSGNSSIPLTSIPPPPPRQLPPKVPNYVSRPNAGNAVPFNYSKMQNNYRPQGFRMNIPRAPRSTGFTNPFAASNGNDDTLGEPNSGFFVRGKHPASLKEYVKRALAHPRTLEEKCKCEKYLYSRIAPLVSSGACFAVKWESEPLPHEKNYELVTSWTPTSKLKSGGSPPKKERFDPRKSPKSSQGKFDNFGSDPLPGSIRRQEDKSKKAAKKRRQQQNKLDKDLLQSKRGKFESSGKSWGSNFLQEWIDEHKDGARVDRDLRFLTLSEFPYRKKSIIPSFDGSRLAHSFPKVLRSLDQSIVDDYFSRNEGRFNPNDYDEVVGTCFEIEKKYFRLTKKPEPSEIRPLSVLHRAFARLKAMAKDSENYKYICDQLRGIRQDLTVQKIRNEFTVAVYEFHARITLENKDLSEFNQCQSQLRHLYADIPNCPNEDEFTAYRLLYFILTRDDQDILSLLNSVPEKARKSQCLSFAIKVHDAYLKGHHIRLFKLLDNPPRMCRNVMDLFIDAERKKFFNVLRASYRPTLKTEVLTRWLNYPNENELCEFAKAQGIELKPRSITEPAKWPKV